MQSKKVHLQSFQYWLVKCKRSLANSIVMAILHSAMYNKETNFVLHTSSLRSFIGTLKQPQERRLPIVNSNQCNSANNRWRYHFHPLRHFLIPPQHHFQVQLSLYLIVVLRLLTMHCGDPLDSYRMHTPTPTNTHTHRQRNILSDSTVLPTGPRIKSSLVIQLSYLSFDPELKGEWLH